MCAVAALGADRRRSGCRLDPTRSQGSGSACFCAGPRPRDIYYTGKNTSGAVGCKKKHVAASEMGGDESISSICDLQLRMSALFPRISQLPTRSVEQSPRNTRRSWKAGGKVPPAETTQTLDLLPLCCEEKNNLCRFDASNAKFVVKPEDTKWG